MLTSFLNHGDCEKYKNRTIKTFASFVYVYEASLLIQYNLLNLGNKKALAESQVQLLEHSTNEQFGGGGGSRFAPSSRYHAAFTRFICHRQRSFRVRLLFFLHKKQNTNLLVGAFFFVFPALL
ncbi:MAG: hypothetical protein ACOYEG_10995 [Petrimonas sp.]|jgi:hypothetical protein